MELLLRFNCSKTFNSNLFDCSRINMTLIRWNIDVIRGDGQIGRSNKLCKCKSKKKLKSDLLDFSFAEMKIDINKSN